MCEALKSPPCSGDWCYVALRLVDRPVATTVDGEASRFEEVAEVSIGENVRPDHLAIARLERVRETWRVDSAFKPQRLGD